MARGLGACADDGADLAGEESALSGPLFVGGLTTSLRKELRYRAIVHGRLPHELQGTLYKNGQSDVFDFGTDRLPLGSTLTPLGDRA